MNTKNTRQVWFITRPERDPAFHIEALEALKIATDNFSLKWKGNRQLHKNYEQELINIGIKRNSISNDGSGGRTWAAMLRTFSYCYLNKDGFLILTKVGQEILKGNNVVDNITKQILTLQIPNAYFLESGFKPQYNLKFKIRPARFLISVCCSPELDFYLTKEEITYFVMTCNNDYQINECIANIKKFRQASSEERLKIKETIATSFEHRERSDNASRDFEMAHSDVAHTFMMICEYTQLVEYTRGKSLSITAKKLHNTLITIDKYNSRYPFNNKYLFSLERMAETNGLDINSFKASRYGDIRPATNHSKKINKAKKLLSSKPQCSYSEAVEILSKQFKISDCVELAKYIVPSTNLNTINYDFITAYLNEEDNLEFENKTAELLKLIGFDVVMHPTILNERTEIDILLKYKGNNCGIIDAKNYKDKFQLSSSLVSHMASEYIPNYESYDGHKLQFFAYVTANNIKGTNNLEKITLRSSQIIDRNIYGFMINAKTLLSLIDYFNDNELPVDDRINIFLKLATNNTYTDFVDIAKLL
ncbi:hypothetical protein [uncultured Clostridium sp.]|uniref:hypothetical protein n=1 Tax=uncultured Clostridium sp. TaxID=59620 RepID=UPI0025F64BC7|nr:hypothetical protein [uncultured Clostridium sp.]